MTEKGVKARRQIIEDNYLIASQLYFMGVKEYIDSMKNAREKKGLTTSTQFQERLEEILMGPHTRKMKEMKGRL